jgi:hypothetical protein
MCSIAKQYFRMLDELQEPLVAEAQIAKATATTRNTQMHGQVESQVH